MTPISTVMAEHMGYYTGSGNVSPVDTAGNFQTEFGFGFGLNFTSVFFDVLAHQNPLTNSSNNPTDAFNNLGPAFSIIPFPYDDGYFKLGLPDLPMDVGVRFGIVPTISVTVNGSSFSYQEIHFGAEARYVLWDFMSLLKVDARLSLDYDGGTIKYSYTGSDLEYVNGDPLDVGTNNYTVNFTYQWGGVSIGTKVMGGLNIPILGSLYGGLGLNMNLGSVTTSLGMNDSFSPDFANTGLSGTYPIATLNGSSQVGYNLFDIRTILGLKLFFFDFAWEYGLLNGDSAFSVFVAFKF